MPRCKRRKKDKATAPPAAGGDGMDALPEDVLAHILGFLPPEEAVRTCVLSQRWRHLWKSATGLHIFGSDDMFLGSVEKLQKFMYHLLGARAGSGLDACELILGHFSCGMWPLPDDLFDDEVQRRICQWFRHAVACRVRILKLRLLVEGVCTGNHWLELNGQPVASEYLTRLELGGVEVHSGFLRLSTCPALEHLVLESCDLLSLDWRISSASLKFLSITDSGFNPEIRNCIDAPNLVSLHLDEVWGRVPVLESMPSLTDAFIRITRGFDNCKHKYRSCMDCDCESCDTSIRIGGNNSPVLLKGLSEARNLTLISEPRKFIFKRDLRWCPTFSKLKTLLLNDYWCVPNDFRPLACILECSPVLEKLTLQLSSKWPKHEAQTERSVVPMEGSAAISEHLKIVEVKCQVNENRIHKLSLFLCAFNMCVSYE